MKVHFIDTDDWTRMYIDGRLVREGHSIDACEAVRLVLGAENVPSEYWEYGEDGMAYEDRCAEYLRESAHKETRHPASLCQGHL